MSVFPEKVPQRAEVGRGMLAWVAGIVLGVGTIFSGWLVDGVLS